MSGFSTGHLDGDEGSLQVELWKVDNPLTRAELSGKERIPAYWRTQGSTGKDESPSGSQVPLRERSDDLNGAHRASNGHIEGPGPADHRLGDGLGAPLDDPDMAFELQLAHHGPKERHALSLGLD